jgi:ribosomal protein L12E/L44/L45/RPP1/RPP2
MEKKTLRCSAAVGGARADHGKEEEEEEEEGKRDERRGEERRRRMLGWFTFCRGI